MPEKNIKEYTRKYIVEKETYLTLWCTSSARLSAGKSCPITCKVCRRRREVSHSEIQLPHQP